MIARVLGCCVVCAAFAAPVPSALAAAPSGFIGMNAEDTYAGDDAYQERMLAMQKDAGVDVVRQNFRWYYSEPERDQLDWRQLDRYVLAAARHGIRVLPILYGEVKWDTTRPPGNKDDCTYPPKHNGDFATWAADIARRYGPGGDLWRANPAVPKLPLQAYEIWNEPNAGRYWACKPDAYAYVKMAREVAKAVHGVDPKADIISAGSPKDPKHPGKYLRDTFKAGGRAVFDGLGVHPYEPSTAAVMQLLQDTRDALDDQGATAMDIWVTEFGWSTGGPAAGGHTYDETTQAQLIKNSLTKMIEQRHELQLRSAVYYDWIDLPPAPGEDDYWGLHTGILRVDGSAKPALAAIGQADKYAG
ncbi:MAG: cellulase family glycosylhydrolase [Solirubrobacteraceae bacterium]|nr:cellulase family glycosylhydrolase [Solirubrobacteraceae bacterium]